MKRIGNLFDTVFSMENLHAAYLDARRGKMKKQPCFNFGVDLGANLKSLHEAIHGGTYQPKPYFQFIVREPKERVIFAPAFSDIVVQHAIYRVIYGIFDKRFISTSFACRKGYGTHRASIYTQRAMQTCRADEYTLKLDVRRFFYSIDRDILRQLIERVIKDRRLVRIMMMFTKIDTPVGIPIGNLLSQLYALIYLNPMDHFIKRTLKIRRYVRYVDDFILIGLTRCQCEDCRRRIVQYLSEILHLKLSKLTIQKIKKGVNFVGYRTWKSGRFIRKYSLIKFRRKVAAGNQAAVMSLLGHAKGTKSIRHMIQWIKESGNENAIRLPKRGWSSTVAHVGGVSTQ